MCKHIIKYIFKYNNSTFFVATGNPRAMNRFVGDWILD